LAKVKVAIGFVKWRIDIQPQDCGFIEENGVFVMPSIDLDNKTDSNDIALKVARKYTMCDLRWISVEDQGFYESIELGEKVVYLKFRIKIPFIMNMLEEGMVWKNVIEPEENMYVPHLNIYREMCVVK